jgi:hypothetical protein
LAVQSRQVLPAEPQAPGSVPAPHTPALQQPPLQGCVRLQVVVQVLFERLQAEPRAQSVVWLQPHLPPPATSSHRVPEGSPRQSSQVLPVLPQAICVVPATQVPALQQPPLQSCVGLQLVVHLCEPVSQASPAGQSLVTLQPQRLARHW